MPFLLKLGNGRKREKFLNKDYDSSDDESQNILSYIVLQ